MCIHFCFAFEEYKEKLLHIFQISVSFLGQPDYTGRLSSANWCMSNLHYCNSTRSGLETDTSLFFQTVPSTVHNSIDNKYQYAFICIVFYKLYGDLRVQVQGKFYHHKNYCNFNHKFFFRFVICQRAVSDRTSITKQLLSQPRC